MFISTFPSISCCPLLSTSLVSLSTLLINAVTVCCCWRNSWPFRSICCWKNAKTSCFCTEVFDGRPELSYLHLSHPLFCFLPPVAANTGEFHYHVRSQGPSVWPHLLLMLPHFGFQDYVSLLSCEITTNGLLNPDIVAVALPRFSRGFPRSIKFCCPLPSAVIRNNCGAELPTLPSGLVWSWWRWSELSAILVLET